MRFIEIEVANEYVKGAGVPIGAAGSYSDVALRIKFSDMWDGMAKHITWLDANGENPTIVYLTVETYDDGYYISPVPAEAKAIAGTATMSIKGADSSKGTLTAKAEFKVLESVYDPDAEEAVQPTPSVVDQIQEQVDTILGTISDAVNAATAAAASESAAAQSANLASGYKDQAAQSAAAAAESADDAEGFAQAAENYKDQAAAIVGLTIDDAMSDTSHNPVENQAIKNYIDSKGTAKLYTGTCSDLPAETAKTVTLDNGAGFALEDGVKILVRFVNGNKASATLNVNSTGAVAMKRRNIDTLTLYSGPSATGIAAGESVLLTYYAGVTPAWMLSSGTASALLYLNRNGRVNDADTSYTTYMARGEALNSSDTNPTANGCISWTYE